jgi:hypothetical protein
MQLVIEFSINDGCFLSVIVASQNKTLVVFNSPVAKFPLDIPSH